MSNDRFITNDLSLHVHSNKDQKESIEEAGSIQHRTTQERDWVVDKVPILQDNFVFILHNEKKALVIDPGESDPVLQFLKDRNLHCEAILITHHHSDHIHGLLDIRNQYECRVYAPQKNKRQLRFGITDFIEEGFTLNFHGLQIEVMSMPGHTLGHIAYWIAQKQWLFSGDVLFALGCGRIFEGTYEQMFQTIQRIKTLPENTLIYCTHDYLSQNEKFCRQEGIPLEGYKAHFPLKLIQEKSFNPFLIASDLESFQKVREKRNNF